MVFVTRYTQYFEIPTNCAASFRPRNDMIGLTLFPVQLVLFTTLRVCTPTSLLTQDVAAKPWGDTTSVFIYHSTEPADACSVDVANVLY